MSDDAPVAPRVAEVVLAVLLVAGVILSTNGLLDEAAWVVLFMVCLLSAAGMLA